METQEATPAKDPFETGAAPWQDLVADLARGKWLGDMQIEYQGVNMVATIEYHIVDHLNRIYSRRANGG